MKWVECERVKNGSVECERVNRWSVEGWSIKEGWGGVFMEGWNVKGWRVEG